VFCPNCGCQAEGESKFCPQCGAPLGGAAAVKTGGSPRWRRIAGIVVGLSVIVVIAVLLLGGGESPTDVAIAFYRAANEGNYARAEGYLAPEVRMAWQMMPMMPSFDTAVDGATKGGTITRIEVEEATEYGRVSATVWLRLDYQDGSREQDVLTLTRVDRRWRIFTSTLLIMP